ncbi:MAG: DUF3185 family protein [Nibricoccus sp.]
MISKILGLVLIVGGIWLVAAGISRKDSLVGQASEAGTSIANKVDGGARTPKHYVYIGGGALAAIVGASLLFRRTGTV